ncbi:DUF1858 domain-containing protein [Mesorhizobium sp.]|uniref:DUF1858 domain-containing protein n=2 Tax=Mesorhizobium sp. TaxID=1871066 RepID=UPI0025F5C254|nr:DUF1858 domain-containing protein [Mesorhizobium sp.]
MLRLAAIDLSGDERPGFDPSQKASRGGRSPRSKAPSSGFVERSKTAPSLFQSNEHTGKPVQDAGLYMRTNAMKRKLNDDTTMDGIMRETPAAIRVVLQHGMLCVGCPIASFHTVSDAAREHDLDEEQLRRDLQTAIESGDVD